MRLKLYIVITNDTFEELASFSRRESAEKYIKNIGGEKFTFIHKTINSSLKQLTNINKQPPSVS